MRGGVFGIISRNEADLITGGAIPKVCRLKEFDYVYWKGIIAANLYYRLTPDLEASSDQMVFLSPFDSLIWTSLICMLGLIWILMVVFFPDSPLQSSATSNASVFVVQLLTMQALNPLPSKLPAKICSATSLLLMLVIFTLYSTSLLKIMLAKPKEKFKDANEVLKSGINVARYDLLFVQTSLESRMIQVSRNYSELPYAVGQVPQKLPPTSVYVMNDVFHGVEHMKRGHLAFVGEPPMTNAAIKASSSPETICGLRQHVVNPKFTSLYFIQSKKSQYFQMFRIGLVKADESGLLTREKKKFLTDFPDCTISVLLYSMPMLKLKQAFYVLLGKFLNIRP